MIKFDLGQIVATPPALAALEKSGENGSIYLNRHVTGDWGDLDEEDKTRNNEALATGERILSAYSLNDGTKIWIITEAETDGNREVTTILLPSDY